MTEYQIQLRNKIKNSGCEDVIEKLVMNYYYNWDEIEEMLDKENAEQRLRDALQGERDAVLTFV